VTQTGFLIDRFALRPDWRCELFRLGWRLALALLAVVLMLMPWAAEAQGLPGVTVSNTGRGTQYSLTLQALALMTVLSLLPRSC